MSILVVEDDVDLLDILCFTVRRAGHEVTAARDGAIGLHLFRSKEPQLVLLDVNLPKLNGRDVCTAIRAEARTPIIMLTALNSEDDVVRGLDPGVDDYITRPFGPRSLLAKIEAVLRRTRDAAETPRRGWQALAVGGLQLDPQWRTVRRAGCEVPLTPTEFKPFFELALHEGQVLPHRTLSHFDRRVWGYEGVDDSSLLKCHVRNIRRKLKDDAAAPTYLHTVPGVGYSFRRTAAAT